MNFHVIKNDFLELEYRTDTLRISGFNLTGKKNILAELTGEQPIPTPYGDFYFRGGHRLWHSPEAMPRSYIPDTAVMVTKLDDGVILEMQAEPGTGIRKQIEIHLAPDKPSVTLVHKLINDGLWPMELAPWVITQYRLGGVGILPMPVGSVDAAGLLPNRHLSFWSYSSFNDPRLKLGDEFILFKAESLPQFKMSYFNPHGWMAYCLEGVLFKKTFGAEVDAQYPDNNSNAEIYCNEDFFELESLAPLEKLSPGTAVEHVETWELFDGFSAVPDDLQAICSTL